MNIVFLINLFITVIKCQINNPSLMAFLILASLSTLGKESWFG